MIIFHSCSVKPDDIYEIETDYNMTALHEFSN